jgi:hypothetical protein
MNVTARMVKKSLLLVKDNIADVTPAGSTLSGGRSLRMRQRQIRI